jgi:hypothetical protein
MNLGLPYIKGGNFIDQLSNHQIFMKNSPQSQWGGKFDKPFWTDIDRNKSCRLPITCQHLLHIREITESKFGPATLNEVLVIFFSPSTRMPL